MKVNEIVYKIRLLGGSRDGYFYKSKRQFSKSGAVFTRKQLSAHLRHSIVGAKYLDGTVEVVEILMTEQRNFEVDSLDNFKLIEKRDKTLGDLLNDDD